METPPPDDLRNDPAVDSRLLTVPQQTRIAWAIHRRWSQPEFQGCLLATGAHRANVLPIPSLFKQDLHLLSGNTSAWFNEIRCEFILSFFDLVDCWRQLRCNPLALAELEPKTDRNVSRFCALLHFCFLAWDTGLDTRAGHGQLTAFQLYTTGGLARAEEAFRSAATDVLFRRAKELAETLLWEQGDPLAELCLKWIHQYWNGFGPTERSELLQQYTDAFQRMHNFVRLLYYSPFHLDQYVQTEDLTTYFATA
ncbi:hypothetical protein RHOSPDRAFT_26611 [Rhodotorula sp. JG-1b]|nr:hypothetical protein RHOSPDRAFT_26611 [Rhodotorula sp. JG-1b]